MSVDSSRGSAELGLHCAGGPYLAVTVIGRDIRIDDPKALSVRIDGGEPVRFEAPLAAQFGIMASVMPLVDDADFVALVEGLRSGRSATVELERDWESPRFTVDLTGFRANADELLEACGYAGHGRTEDERVEIRLRRQLRQRFGPSWKADIERAVRRHYRATADVMTPSWCEGTLVQDRQGRLPRVEQVDCRENTKGNRMAFTRAALAASPLPSPPFPEAFERRGRLAGHFGEGGR